jgi:hypothetical protein
MHSAWARQSEVSPILLTYLFISEAEFVNKKELTVVPGPGHTDPKDKYTTKETASKMYSINRTEKHPNRMERKQPGPFDYTIPSKVVEKAQY